MKILVIVEKGMLGHVVKNYFKSKGYMIKGTDRKNGDYIYDALDIDNINTIIKDFKPTHIINCIGILNKNAEDNKKDAIFINSYFPHYMDELCKKRNIKFIHISTDCVFEGTKGSYKENDIKDAKSFYGMTKSLGEINNNYNLTLRTSIIGPDNNKNGIGLFKWFMESNKSVNGYKNVFWSGVTTLELSKCIERTILDDLNGLYHVTNNKKISKYDLLNLFKKEFNKDIDIIPFNDVTCDKSFINTSTYNFKIPSYEVMVKEMHEWMLLNKEE